MKSSTYVGIALGIAAAAAVNGIGQAVRGVAARPQNTAAQCRAVDGDTLRCGELRVRLVEIDSPEMPGHCRKGRVCAPGDPLASKAALQRAVESGPVQLVRYGTDKYGRVLADARVGGRSLSCMQITGGYAMRQLKWADYGVTRRECP